MLPRHYKVTKWFVIANYITIPGSFGFGVFFGYGVIYEIQQRAFFVAGILLLFTIFFIWGGFYTLNILPLFKETITISDQQITQERPGQLATSIRWDEEFTIRDRLILARLELTSQDGQRMIRLEHQLEGYKEIIAFITTKLIEKHDEENLAEISPQTNIPAE